MRRSWIVIVMSLTACAAPVSSVGPGPSRAAGAATSTFDPATAGQDRVRARRSSGIDLPRPEIVELATPRGPVTIEGFALDLGVGEAPYDDGPRSVAPERPGRAGFSDALIRLSYEHQVAEGTFLVTSASAFRVQDRQIFQALQDLDVSWAVVGIRISF